MEPGIYTGEYKGKEVLRFQFEHKYIFELKYNGKLYTLHAFSDVTYSDEIEEVDLWIHYSSSISINQNWNIIKSDVESENDSEVK